MLPRCLAALCSCLLLATAGLLAAAAEPPATVLCLGDSLTAGYGVLPEEAWPALLQEDAARRGMALRIVNAGLSGETSAGGLRRLDWLLKRPCQVLIVALGGNDALRGLDPEQTETNLAAIVAKARQANPQVRIILAGMCAPPNLGDEYTRRFAAIFPRLAQTQHLELIPFLLADVAGQAQLNQADGIHPNPRGHQMLAANVARILWPPAPPK